MSVLKVTAKGQVTLKKEILHHLGVRPGESLSVSKLPSGTIEVRAAKGSGRISDAFGILKHRGKRKLSVKEIGRIAAEGWAGKR
jgi:bifunctional DNA-binding transcriptional regulator/antitoxin component of YhaV-PrlF toxin-antitoxin module